ncbi:MAG: glutamate-1-semialdehyde-2,1-aminomutase [Nitrospinota bacterium]|nr:MAG: glutamate-1-semialdehyde-2,1-aminomutase [Nitrospinota bacterium]
METKRSQELFAQAQRYIPGGVNSPVRAFRAVGGHPLFIQRAAGSRIYDVDGNGYIDYVGSWGPLILGHAHPQVVAAIQRAARNGSSYGAPTELEVELARLITEAVPSIELVRMVNSGTEAAMSAIRLARGYTRRSKIIKFDGCYHGHVDGLLVQAGSGATTFGIPDSLGVPEDYTRNTISLPYNDLGAVEEVVSKQGEEIACIILEPIAGNMGVIPPQEGFLQGIRRLCSEYGIVLIFDEVITGFRVAYGGAQSLYGVTPDLTILGKIIGGGLPVGAFGGKREIMETIAPLGGVYQAGTLSGNPLAMMAGIETLKILSQEETYRKLEEGAQRLTEGMKAAAEKVGIPTFSTRVGSCFCTFFQEGPVTDYASAKRSDTQQYARFFHTMLAEGIYFAPSQFEAGFLSLAHSSEDIEQTIAASTKGFKAALEGTP